MLRLKTRNLLVLTVIIERARDFPTIRRRVTVAGGHLLIGRET